MSFTIWLFSHRVLINSLLFILQNIVTLNRNGPEADVLASYRASQAYLDFWFFCQSPVRERVGNQIVYTTPTSDTFYYAATYKGKYVVFVIIARTFWLVGFFNQHDFFQMLWEDQRLYIGHPHMQLIGPDANHWRISGVDVEQTNLGCHWARKGLDDIYPITNVQIIVLSPRDFGPALEDLLHW